MDVAILCGGYGTRLDGLWDSAKCLVPLGDGRPILHHILVRVHRLRPRRIYLLTGHKDGDVIDALRSGSMLSPRLQVAHSKPNGTAAALRQHAPTFQAPLMVLNGDTLPLYPLQDLAQRWAVDEPDVLIAMGGALPAGAVMLGVEALERLQLSSEPDFARWLEREAFGDVVRIGVSGFLDVGTPHGFELAKVWK